MYFINFSTKIGKYGRSVSPMYATLGSQYVSSIAVVVLELVKHYILNLFLSES